MRNAGRIISCIKSDGGLLFYVSVFISIKEAHPADICPYLRLQTNRANLRLKPRGWQVLRIKISCLAEVRTWLGRLGELYSALHLTAVRWFYMASTARVPAYSKMPQVRRNLMCLAVFSSTTCMSVGLCVLSLFARAATMHYRSLRSRWRYTFVDLLPSRDPKSIMFVLSDLGLQNRAWMMTSRIVFMSDMKSYTFTLACPPCHLRYLNWELYDLMYIKIMLSFVVPIMWNFM